MTYHDHYRSYDDDRHTLYSASSRRYSDSDTSDDSHHSKSTAPTEYDYCYTVPSYPSYCMDEVMPEEQLDENDTCYEEPECQPPSVSTAESNPRASVETYASTVPSIHEPDTEEPAFDMPIYQPQLYFSDDLPATPSDFAELFPSTRRLMIAHDDAASDGNMNLKINTQVKDRGRIQNLTLFHLRMYDLKNREFSLRRYDRGSGREVCHTLRKYRKTAAEKRPAFQRSWSNALATFRSISENKMSTPRRSDSGYESELNFADCRPRSAGAFTSRSKIPTNTTKMEFSNYAQVEVKRRGTRSNKRYDFEYWGNSYQWKRVVRKEGQGTQVSYHLFHAGNDQPLAHIVPDPLGAFEKHEEELKGGWVPPCSMWISDQRICHMQNDVSDVVVAAGIVALVDDCIKSRFHNKPSRHLSIPMAKLSLDMDNVVKPKKLINGVLSRPSTSQGMTSHRFTPLR